MPRAAAPPTLLFLILALALAAPAAAHVEYVAQDPDAAGDPLAFLVATLSEPANLALLLGGAVAALAAVALLLRLRTRLPDAAVLRRTLESYADLVPWMLRLSAGLPLVGAGFAGYLFTPAIPESLRLPQVVVGFLLLFGLATRAAAAAGLLGYLATLAWFGAPALLAFEYAGAFLAIILLGPGRPSADEMLDHVARDATTLYHGVDPVHRLGAWFRARAAPLQRYAPTIVRAGLGATFIYLGVAEKLAQPAVAMAVVHDLGLAALLPLDPRMWVLGAGLVEAALGAALILGALTREAAATAFLVLTLTLFALPDDPVLPHVTLFGLASVVFTWGAGPLSVDARLDARS